MENFKQNKYLQIFTIYLRYLIGGAFVFASIIKIEGRRFTGESGEHVPIDQARHFFETLYRSGLYWQFLGLAQFVAGGLLMTQKFSKLGALVFLPISLNIFIITISYDFNFTPVITACILLANIYLLLWDWNTFKILLELNPKPESTVRLENHPVWVSTGLLLFFLRWFTEFQLMLTMKLSGFLVVCLLVLQDLLFIDSNPVIKQLSGKNFDEWRMSGRICICYFENRIGLF